ncbi:hypothetical protein BC828DRAFT_436822 [Blastocladiella britannica]|nr:hypothetical protein BC828DRAFT_436822 [Blastocladiella britannica]
MTDKIFTATYAGPATAPVALASVSLPLAPQGDAITNHSALLALYAPALLTLQENINAALTARMSDEVASTPAPDSAPPRRGVDKRNNGKGKPSQEIAEDEGEDEGEEEDDNSDEDASTVPPEVLAAMHEPAAAATPKRPRVDHK